MVTQSLSHRLADLPATHALGRRIAAIMQPGDAILLTGDLGAGKSELARAVIRAAAHDPALDVPSPTYTLVQSYDTPRGTVHHYDLWRLDGPAPMTELGWDEARDGIVIVEWPDRLGALKPPGALEVTLAIVSDGGRVATIGGWDDRPGFAA